VSAEKLQALPLYETSPLFTPTEKLVLKYVDCMTLTPVVVPETLFAELKAQFSAAQLVELTATIAWENYRARYDHAFGIESDGFSEASFCAVPVRTAP
jgi:alkylhydroperoxidase family enzyme